MEREKRVEYFVFKFADSNIIYDMKSAGFIKKEDAIKFCKENDWDEVEAAIWYSDESFNNYELADDFETVYVNH